MTYLLDTNTWIHYLKNPSSPIRAKLAALRPSEIVTCSIVRSELLHGAEKYGHRSRRNEYAKLRHSLELAGTVIGPHDLQIAAICLRHAATLVTNNVREFSRVDGLKVEDWQ